MTRASVIVVEIEGETGDAGEAATVFSEAMSLVRDAVSRQHDVDATLKSRRISAGTKRNKRSKP